MEEITDEEYLAILESNVQEAKKELSAAQKEYDIVIEVVLIEEAKMRSEQFSLTAIGEPIPDEMEKRHAVQYADNSTPEPWPSRCRSRLRTWPSCGPWTRAPCPHCRVALRRKSP